MIKVSNMKNTAGNVVKNQFIIKTDIEEIFQSYDSTICTIHKPSGKIWLDANKWDYSNTTLKYLKLFLCVRSINDIREGIKTGKYILEDLNI